MRRVVFLDEADAERAPLALALARVRFGEREAFASAGLAPRPLAESVRAALLARGIEDADLGGQSLSAVEPGSVRLMVDLLDPAPEIGMDVVRRSWRVPRGDVGEALAAIEQALDADAPLIAPAWHFDFADGPDGRRLATLREAGATRSVRAPSKGPPALLARVFDLYEAFSPAEYGRLQRAAMATGPVTVSVHPTDAARAQVHARLGRARP